MKIKQQLEYVYQCVVFNIIIPQERLQAEQEERRQKEKYDKLKRVQAYREKQKIEQEV